MRKRATRLGPTRLGDERWQFSVWAPLVQTVDLHVVSPSERLARLEKDERGYHQGIVEGVEPDSLYFYRLDGRSERPDPASRCQPQGVHRPSQVIDPEFPWEDRHWFGLPLSEYILYEIHVGTFTPEGTFAAIIPRLGRLKELGITAIELMPVAQFPGERNWGYDGVHPFAVQNSYGGPAGLKQLVDACHGQGLAVVLDVVYNHLGPEGNYLHEFAPYFTDSYKTPWGPAVNFDGPYSDEVRNFFTENALYWLGEFHIDALRLDAVHAIKDFSARPFLEELALAAHEQASRLNRRFHLIAESDLNNARIILPRSLGGLGLHAQWSDDFHHSLHALLTGERNGYYRDFGRVGQLAKAFRQSHVYDGQYSAHRKRRHGNSASLTTPDRFVVCAQNHDQIGNRMLGERLSRLVSFEKLKLAAGAVLLSPFIPLLFMGEEYGETAPFQYFISHSDGALIDAVRRGRSKEFAAFQCQQAVPDPQDEATFLQCKLRHASRDQGHHSVLEAFYGELIALRKDLGAQAATSREGLEAAAYEKARVLFLHRRLGPQEFFLAFNFGDSQAIPSLPVPAGRWRKRLDSADRQWKGNGSSAPDLLDSEGEAELVLSPSAFCLFARSEEA